MNIIRTEFTLFLGVATETNKDGEKARAQFDLRNRLFHPWLPRHSAHFSPIIPVRQVRPIRRRIVRE
jgi:hypothetical protein